MTNPSRLLAFVQMLDSAFPIGSFSHSFGLETFVQQGKINNLQQLEQYMKAQLQAAIVPLEVLCLKGIYEALDCMKPRQSEQVEVQGSMMPPQSEQVLGSVRRQQMKQVPESVELVPDSIELQHDQRAQAQYEQAQPFQADGGLEDAWFASPFAERLIRLDAICHTQRAARESREGLHKMGKRLIRLGTSLYPEARLPELEKLLQQHNGYGTYPTVFAWIAWHLQLDIELAISGYLHTSIQMMVNSALRLMSLGQTDGQLLIRKTVPYALALWEETKQYDYTEPFSYGIVQEIYAMQHETLYSRLFMS